MSETATKETNGELAKPTNTAPALPSSRIGSHGVMLTSFDELARFSKMVSMSGFAPKGMERFEAIGAAIQLGLEVGLSPMAALQSTAVINGRPAIYGDAAKALVEASGVMEDYDQWYELDGKRLKTADGHARTPTAAELKNDSLTCCVLSKRNSRKALVTTFSVGDAKNAALWGKAGPWSQYPARMLLFRARGFNLRDNFGDVLKGLRTVEEVQDQPFDVTPTQEAKSPQLSLVEKLHERAKSVEPNEAAPVDAPAEPVAETTAAEPQVADAAPTQSDDSQDGDPAAERLDRATKARVAINLANRSWEMDVAKRHDGRKWVALTADEQEAEAARLEALMPVEA